MSEEQKNYAVVRFAKLKTAAQMKASANHNFRKEQPLNADPSKQHLNEELIKLDTHDYADAFKKKMAENNITPRKDNVKELEIMMTFTKEDSGVDLDKWKEKSVGWVQDYFGKENVVSAVYHGDESSPHIHAIVVPIVDGKLYASEYINGKSKCMDMHTSYAKAVEDLGMERGMENTPVSYETMQQLRAATKKVADENLPIPRAGERIEDYYSRANDCYKSERLASYRKRTEILRQSEKEIEKYKRIAMKAEDERRKTMVADEKLKKTIEQKDRDIKSIQTDFARYLKNGNISEKDLKNLKNLNKVFGAFNSGLLGKENDDKRKIMLSIMNEAIAAYDKSNRNIGEIMDTRENDTETVRKAQVLE